MDRIVKIYGGIGEKKSNNGKQWYIQNRIYDTTGISPALTTYKSDYLILEEHNDNMNENNIPTKEEYKQLILDVLYETELIDEEIYKKCSKPHIQDLPYDNRTNDTNKLEIRKTTIQDKIKETENSIKENIKTYKDTYKENNKIINSLSKKYDPEQNSKLYDKWGKYDYETHLDNMINDFNIYYENYLKLQGYSNDYFKGLEPKHFKNVLNYTIDKAEKWQENCNKINQLPYGGKLINKNTLKQINSIVENTQQLKTLIKDYDNNTKILNDYQDELNKI